MLKNIWTKVRSTAFLSTVEGQHHGKERRCNIGPTTMDGTRNAEERLDEGQHRRFSHPRHEATLRKGEELQHRADSEVRRWKAHALQRFMIAIPAGGVLQTLGRPRRRADALSPGKYWDARFVPTMAMRRAGGVLQ